MTCPFEEKVSLGNAKPGAELPKSVTANSLQMY